MQDQLIVIPFRYPDPIEYRDVPGFPGYRVGNDGSVWSLWRRGRIKAMGTEWREMKITALKVSKHRFVRLARRIDGASETVFFYVHRLVLTLFVCPCPEGREACHGPDRDPGNNNSVNLRWDTRKGNFEDKIIHGTHHRGSNSPTAQLTDEQVIEIRRLYATGEYFARELGAKFGVSKGLVTHILSGTTWNHLISEHAAVRSEHIGKPKGSRHGNAKLTESDVIEIRKAHKEGVPGKELAIRFKVGPMTISTIVNRKRWTHVE